MDIPNSVISAVARDNNERTVIEATRMRDAEVWAHALTWQPGTTRFKRDLRLAQTMRGHANWLARAALVAHGPRAMRYLLDMAHRNRYKPVLLAYTGAWHSLRRRNSTTTTRT